VISLAGATSASDAELIARARTGDARAHDQLRTRHVEAARRMARGLGRLGPDADALVERALADVRDHIERGTGPDIVFRVELLTTVGRLAADAPGAPPTGAGRPPGRSAPTGDRLLARAYASLPEQWQAVLWYADVERVAPAEVAVILGVGPADVASLGYRARARLRHTYLVLGRDDRAVPCRLAQERIEAYLLGALSGGETVRVKRHLGGCASCRRLVTPLADLRASLVHAVAPQVLGPACDSYLAGATETAPKPQARAATISRPRRRRRSLGRAMVGMAAMTIVLAGLVTWMVYGASSAGVSDAEVALDAERRGEFDPIAGTNHGPRADTSGAEGVSSGTGDGTQPDVPQTGAPPEAIVGSSDGSAPAGPTPANSASPGSAPDATASDPAPSATAPSSASSPSAASGAPSTATTSPAATPPSTSAPPTTAPRVVPPPAADLSLAISGIHHGSTGVSLVVTNIGPQAAAAPTVDFVLRRLPRWPPAGCSPNPTRLTMTCWLGALAAGHHGYLNVNVFDGTDVVGVRVLSGTADPAPANNIWTILPGTISLDRPLSGIS
jgi:DNA-directed RNA polymerase specialized sigma24 family protein